MPDVLVHVTLPIPRLMARLRSHGEALLPHENETFLAKLQEGYRQVGNVLKKRRKVELFEFDAANTEIDAIVDEVEAVCRRLVEKPAPDPDSN